ncbi:MAG: hypothetical protein P8Y37_05590 [Anaerolineales bacterium]
MYHIYLSEAKVKDILWKSGSIRIWREPGKQPRSFGQSVLGRTRDRLAADHTGMINRFEIQLEDKK